MNMKKFLSIALWLLVLWWFTFANGSSTSESRRSPEYKSMNFQATLENWVVNMSWAPFSVPAWHSFVYWKLMRSQSTDNPVYKESGSEYIRYESNLDFTWDSDKSPKSWTSRYRICAITKASDWYHRYCSNEVKKISIDWDNSYVEKEEQKTETKTEVKTTLTDAQKTVLDQLAVDFLKKLEEKFWTDYSKKNIVLGTVVSQLNTLGKRQVKMKVMITYLVQKLEATIDPLDAIKNILKVD